MYYQNVSQNLHIPVQHMKPTLKIPKIVLKLLKKKTRNQVTENHSQIYEKYAFNRFGPNVTKLVPY